ncbi:hypothetical protein BaRGS_00023121 [Batillaria attramentaria]|uniref:Secreted protein n=1 Tax=Batillaria attramentaria TaxID=370345 RepID=A0ABD0KF91_9CAEN
MRERRTMQHQVHPLHLMQLHMLQSTMAAAAAGVHGHVTTVGGHSHTGHGQHKTGAGDHVVRHHGDRNKTDEIAGLVAQQVAPGAVWHCPVHPESVSKTICSLKCDHLLAVKALSCIPPHLVFSITSRLSGTSASHLGG